MDLGSRFGTDNEEIQCDEFFGNICPGDNWSDDGGELLGGEEHGEDFGDNVVSGKIYCFMCALRTPMNPFHLWMHEIKYVCNTSEYFGERNEYYLDFNKL